MAAGVCYNAPMRLFILYGPPASGKLTIAEKLSAATGIPLFHNHQSRDLVGSIYSDVMQHYDLVDRIRFDVFDYCAKNGTDLIFTYVYEGEEADDVDIQRFTETIARHQGSVVFIELTADRNDLIARVNNDSRKQHKKLLDPETIARITEDMSRYSISYVDPAVKINTSELGPDAAVDRIIREVNL